MSEKSKTRPGAVKFVQSMVYGGEIVSAYVPPQLPYHLGCILV